MRLIDADKLRHELIMGHDLVGAKYTDMADTVDAIPIEWIKEYVGYGVSDDIFQRNKRFVLNMIKDWEKENEVN